MTGKKLMTKLDILRKQIDMIDEKILTALAKRMEIVRKIGKFKKERKISTFDKKRWQEMVTTNVKRGEAVGLPKNFIKNLLSLIHKYSLEIQEKS